MSYILAIIALLTAQSGDLPGKVRMGLFSLFKPEAVHARIATGQSATLETGGAASNRIIIRGDTVRVRAVEDNLKITVSDSSGRIKQSFQASEARIIPARLEAIELILPGKMKRELRGEISIVSGARPREPLKIILTTSRESAVASIVAAELSGYRASESLKALAIVARTFMLSHAGRHAHEGFDFCDTTHCQLYRGEQDLSRQAISPVVANAVAQTEGEYLSFRGKPIEGYYTAACGGLSVTPEMAWGGTSASGYPYQRTACRWCLASPYRRWERAANVAKVFDALSEALGFKLSAEAEIRVERSEPDGLAHSVVIRDRGRQVTLSTDDFRRAIGRRLKWGTVLSPSFEVERRGERFVFRGRGFGSQVGFCLAGAVAQAESGRGCREILNFYFPQTEIKNRSSHE